MNRKVIAIFALLIVALGIGAVSAFDLSDLTGGDSSSEAEIVTIDGIDFNIPAGYKEDKKLAIDGVENETHGIKYSTWGKTYSKDKDVMSIGVATYDDAEVDDTIASYIGGDEKTINGVKGYEYNVDPFKGFAYAKDGKLVIITTTDESILDEVVVK